MFADEVPAAELLDIAAAFPDDVGQCNHCAAVVLRVNAEVHAAWHRDLFRGIETVIRGAISYADLR